MMKPIQRICILFSLAFALLISNSQSSLAAHLSGGEFSYICLGNDSFLLTFKLYGDCGLTALPTTAPVTLTPMSSCMPPLPLTMNQVDDREVTPVCTSSASTCSGGALVGMRVVTYQLRIGLAGFTSCCQFLISYDVSQRHTQVTTMNVGNLYVETMLNRCITPCNNSPVFDTYAPMFIATGKDQKISFGAIDTLDRDSLVYSLVKPLEIGGAPHVYNGSYSELKPLTFLGFPNNGAPAPSGFRINAETGLLDFRPTASMYSIIAVKVKEYRNIAGTPTLIGEVTRDLVVITDGTNFTGSMPVISGTEVQKVCAGSQLCFKIAATDANSADSTKLSWNRGIPGATFNTTKTKKDTATFCWTPSGGDTSHRPYYFTVTARDNSCGLNNYVQKTFSITVAGNTPITGSVSKTIKCRTATFKPTVTSGQGKLSYIWTGSGGFSSNDSTPDFTYAANGNYPYTLKITSLNSCDTLTILDTVKVNMPTAVFAGNDTVVCKGSTLVLTATPLGGTAPIIYSWNGGAGITQTYSSTIDSNGMYRVTMTDSNGCVATDTLMATLYNAVVNAGPDDSICFNNTPIGLVGAVPPGGLWSGNGVTGGHFFNPSISGPGTHNLVYTYTNGAGCSFKDSILMKVLSPVLVNAGQDYAVCVNGSVITLAATPSGGTWTGTAITGGNKFDPDLAGPGSFELIYEVVKGKNCKSSDTIVIKVSANPVVNAGPDDDICANENPAPMIGLPVGGAWGGPGINGNFFNPAAAGAGIHMLTYTFTDTNGCSSTDTMNFRVKLIPVTEAGPDRTLCANSGLTALGGTPSGGSWSGSLTGVINQKDFEPGLAGPGIYRLYYIVSVAGCSNIDSMDMTVQPAITAAFTGTPTSGFHPLNVSFTDQSLGTISTYSWDFGDPASGASNTSANANPQHTYSSKGAFTVKLKVTGGACVDSVTKSNYITTQTIGIEEGTKGRSLLMYPNPSNGDVTLFLDNKEGEKFRLMIYDNMGREVMKVSEITESYLIRKNTLSAGVYRLRMHGDAGAVYNGTLVIE
jgi:PKD repeat protein